jgi:hypothetical protein
MLREEGVMGEPSMTPEENERITVTMTVNRRTQDITSNRG